MFEFLPGFESGHAQCRLICYQQQCLTRFKSLYVWTQCYILSAKVCGARRFYVHLIYIDWKDVHFVYIHNKKIYIYWSFAIYRLRGRVLSWSASHSLAYTQGVADSEIIWNQNPAGIQIYASQKHCKRPLKANFGFPVYPCSSHWKFYSEDWITSQGSLPGLNNHNCADSINSPTKISAARRPRSMTSTAHQIKPI